MLRTRAVSFARAVRAFATAKEKPFLSDAIAKAAIGKDEEVATSFVSAFAPVVHQQSVRVASVSSVPETTGLSLARDMKHDIAFRYSVGKETAVMEVVPQHYNRALVEIQLRSEHYLPGRSLAHASGHCLAAVEEEAKVVRAEKLKPKEQQEAKRARPKSPSKESQKEYDSAVYTAYVRVEPVHLLMLSDFCYAHDTAAKVWRAPKSSSVLAGGKYGWASPLFSTFRLTTGAGSVRLRAGVEDPGPNSFASSLRDRLSITIVHLPLVPSALDDKAAWDKVATLPEHQVALESAELREWLHYLAHTSVKDGKVEMPPELRTHRIFRKSAEMAEELLRTPGGFSYSEKEMVDFSLQAEREKEEALEQERAAAAAALEKERAAAAAALEKERAAAAERERTAREEERAAAATAREEERAAAAEREAALRAELERLKKPGSGTP
jgi:hypothetical protein